MDEEYAVEFLFFEKSLFGPNGAGFPQPTEDLEALVDLMMELFA